MFSLSGLRISMIAFFTCLTLVLTACGKSSDKSAQQQKAPPPPVVEIQIAEPRKLQPLFEFPASIESLETAAISSKVSARVTARYVIPGAIVKKGDLLFELDDTDYKIELAKAEAARQLAEANKEKAAANWERAEKLIALPEKVISEAEYELAKAEVETAKAEVAVQNALVEKANQNLGETKIHAPFGGKISAANVAVGDYVTSSPGTAAMVEIVKLDPIYAIAEVDQQIYNSSFAKRDKLKAQGIEVPPSPVTLILAGSLEFPHQGSFENWDSTATAGRGTIAGRVRFPNPDGRLLPGQNVTLKVRGIEPQEQVMVPQKAVAQDQQGFYVMKLNVDDVVERQSIGVGIREGMDWGVIEGLDGGERIIIEGLQKVRPGIKVEIKEKQQ